MLVYVVAVAVAILIVPLTGGRLSQLAKIRVRRSWLLFAGLILQIGLELVDLPRARYDDVGFTILLASYVLIIGFGLSNLLLTGMGVITIGIALNAFAIALNQGMPYRAPEGERIERSVKHHQEGPDDILPELGDYIVLGSPVDASISFGDLIISVGLIDLTFRASRRSRRSRRRSGEDDRVADTDTDIPTEVEAEADTEIDLASVAAQDAATDAAAARQAETEAASGWTVDPATRSSASSTRGS
jgi:hypothetical protein